MDRVVLCQVGAIPSLVAGPYFFPFCRCDPSVHENDVGLTFPNGSRRHFMARLSADAALVMVAIGALAYHAVDRGEFFYLT